MTTVLFCAVILNKYYLLNNKVVLLVVKSMCMLKKYYREILFGMTFLCLISMIRMTQFMIDSTLKLQQLSNH